MTTTHELERKRLNRLIESGRCRATEAPEYSDELRRMAEKIEKTGVVERQSRFFKALGDKTRLWIMKLLEAREMCVCEIMVALDLTQPTASHHLGILENAGLVKGRKEGRWVFYSLADPPLIENMRRLKVF